MTLLYTDKTDVAMCDMNLKKETEVLNLIITTFLI